MEVCFDIRVLINVSDIEGHGIDKEIELLKEKLKDIRINITQKQLSRIPLYRIQRVQEIWRDRY